MRRQILLALAVLTVALMARTAYIVHAQTPTAAELRAKIAVDSPGAFEVFESTQLEFEKAFRNGRPLTEPTDE